MSKVKRLPKRSQVKLEDTWDLAKLYASDEAWEADLARLETDMAGFETFRGKLGEAKTLAACLKFDSDYDRLGERLGTIRSSEDDRRSGRQPLPADARALSKRGARAGAGGQLSFGPEIMAIPDAEDERSSSAAEMAPYRLLVERMLRYKPHTLSEKEEELLAMQGEMAGAAEQGVSPTARCRSEVRRGEDEKGRTVELSNATFIKLLDSPNRNVRKTAFHQYYEQFTATRTRSPRRCTARSRKMSTTPKLAAIRARSRRPCSPTTCRVRFTTT